MMMDISITPENLNLVSFSLLIFSALLSLIFIYFKTKTTEIAKKTSIKALKEYENELQKQSNTKYSLTFRDESVRNELIKHVAIKSIDIKIKLWEELYRLFFDYKNSMDFDKGTPLKKYEEIIDSLKRNQKEILINSIYLGGNLTILLSKMNSHLIFLTRKEYHLNNKVGAMAWLKEVDEKNIELSEIINKIQKEISTTLYTNQSLKSYEFTDAELEKINEIRKEQIQTLPID